jgi:SAM-dependent methyltransferase
LLLYSYREYFSSLSGLLTEGGENKPSVDRRLNVLGSGSLHSRKFFPVISFFLGSNTPSALLDLGCGDGAFLEYVHQQWPALRVAAVDLSLIAIKAAVDRLKNIGVELEATIAENAVCVELWAGRLPPTIREAHPLVVSMWFVAHEFSGGEPATVVHFFRKLHQHLPRAEIIIGEIVRIPSEHLAKEFKASIVPEFLLFHKMSGQGVLSWPEWRDVLSKIPYKVASESLFDLVKESETGFLPSSFVWHLKPCLNEFREGAL